MHGSVGRVMDILLVEDNPGDARLAEEALAESKARCNLFTVGDGAEAMAFLRQQGKYVSVPRPDLILLDLNLPRKSGYEVLEEVKTDDNLKRIPIVVLTVSRAEEDLLKCYNQYANCYITKPLNFEHFVEVMAAIKQFWLTVVNLPPK